MPRKPGKVPAYCRHKASGQAVVRLDRLDHYLGPYGSPESYSEYERLHGEWRLRRQEAAGTKKWAANDSTLTVANVVQAYLKFAETYYVHDGKPTKEYGDMEYAARPLLKLYGATLVRDFGPLALKAVRQHMIEVEDLSRRVTNSRTNRIKRIIKWAVSEELAPPGAYEALRAVAGLRYGRTNARETDPVEPVPQEWVDATLPYLSPQVAAMVQLQQLAAMRPGEVVRVQAAKIDMTADVWVYRPFEHKNRWRGHDKAIPLGPKAQEIIRRFLKLSTTAYLFSPQDAESWRNSERRLQRQSPMTPSQAARSPKQSPRRAKRVHYDTSSYRRAITYAIKKANRDREAAAAKKGMEPTLIPQWFPLQLRHSRATEIRKKYGIEAAQVALGHTRADVTQIYAERNLNAAVQIAREIG